MTVFEASFITKELFFDIIRLIKKYGLLLLINFLSVFEK